MRPSRSLAVGDAEPSRMAQEGRGASTNNSVAVIHSSTDRPQIPPRTAGKRPTAATVPVTPALGTFADAWYPRKQD